MSHLNLLAQLREAAWLAEQNGHDDAAHWIKARLHEIQPYSWALKRPQVPEEATTTTTEAR